MSRNLALWTSILAGPLIWLSTFQAKFALTPWACVTQTKYALFLVAALGLLLTTASALLGWREWKALGADLPSETGGPVPRARSMAVAGIVLSVGSFLVVLSQAVPDVLLGACE